MIQFNSAFMDSSWVLGAHNLEINKNKDLLHRNPHSGWEDKCVPK